MHLHTSFSWISRVLAGCAALVLMLSGCTNEVTMKQKPVLECPDPFTPCKPGTFDQVTFDTGTTGYGYYLVIDRVQGLISEDDEYGLAFAADRRARTDGLATIRGENLEGPGIVDRISRVRIVEVDQVVPRRSFKSRDLTASIGTPAYFSSTDTFLLAGRLPNRLRTDYDIFSAELKQHEIVDKASRQYVSSVIHWDAQPAFSPDGTTMYFSTGRHETIGGTDIYMSRLQSDGTWSEPEGVGPSVNTGCDELSPFVSGDGKWLYFSSSGHETVGGYDIFRSRLTNGLPGQAENLGIPINTPKDELFPSAPANADPDTLLYYSSNQIGSKGFDTYVLHRLFRGRPGEVATEDKPDTVRLTGVVRRDDGTPVEDATVTILERDDPDSRDSTVSDREGRYLFDILEGRRYDVTASKEGSLYGSETVEIPIYNRRDSVNRDVVFLDTVVFRVNFPFNDDSNPYEYTLDNRGQPSDRKWTDVIDEAAGVLRRIDPASGTRIELVGHTDPIGSDAYNIGLGRRRAEFVKRELVKRGVPESILVVRTQGESQPLPMHPNEQDELYRARLRRVELFRRDAN